MFVDIDAILSAGEAAPDCVLPCAGALECVLAVEGLELGGRIECFLVAKPAVGRGRLAIEGGSSVLSRSQLLRYMQLSNAQRYNG